MKRVAIIIFSLLSVGSLDAQSYNTAFGLRMGTEWGFTVQQRILKRTTLELIAQSSLEREEFTLTLLGEEHFPILTKRLNVYLGGGFHKGWGNKSSFAPEDGSENTYTNPYGITMIAGAEITLGRLNISYDFKPAVNLEGGARGFYFQTGVSLRYVIIRKRWKLFKKKINWRFWEK